MEKLVSESHILNGCGWMDDFLAAVIGTVEGGGMSKSPGWYCIVLDGMFVWMIHMGGFDVELK